MRHAGEELKAELMRVEPLGWQHLWELVIERRKDYLHKVVHSAHRLAEEDEERAPPPADSVVLDDRDRSVTWRNCDWVTMDDLFMGVWGYEETGFAVSELLRAHIRNIRAKCRVGKWPELIASKRGARYRLAMSPNT